MQALGQLRYPNAVQALSDQLSYHQRGPDAHGGARRAWPASDIRRRCRSSRSCSRTRTPTCAASPSKDCARTGNREALADTAADGAERAIEQRAARAALRERQARRRSTAAFSSSSRRLAMRLSVPSRSDTCLTFAPPSAPVLAESLLKDQSAMCAASSRTCSAFRATRR